jgi:hypothetical protein
MKNISEIALFALTVPVFGQTIVFAPRMLDPVSGRMMSNIAIVVRGERIESMSANSSVPANAIVLPSSVTSRKRRNARAIGAIQSLHRSQLELLREHPSRQPYDSILLWMDFES